MARKLDELMEDITEYCPEANLYIEDSNNFNLMKGPTHDDTRDCHALQENVASHAFVRPSGGGGW